MLIGKETKIGLLTITALVILYLGVSFLKGEKFLDNSNVYYTMFDDNNGLNKSGAVFYKGIQVGRVKDVELVPNDNYRIKVTFSVRRDINLTKTSKAKVIASFLSKAFIDLVINEGEIVKNHGFIDGITESNLVTSIAQGALPALKSIQDITDLTNALLVKLFCNVDKINATISNLEQISHSMNVIINKNTGAFNSISNDVSKLINTISNESSGIVNIVKDINTILDDIKAREIVLKCSNILDNLEVISSKIHSGNNSISNLLNSGEFYFEVHDSVCNLNKLIVDLREYPGRYVNFSLFGSSQKKRTYSAKQ